MKDISMLGLQVLRLFNEDLTLSLKGSEIVRQTGLLSGTVFVILMSLERDGWLSSEWETLDQSDVGRPRERLYRLTELGHHESIQHSTD